MYVCVWGGGQASVCLFFILGEEVIACSLSFSLSLSVASVDWQ